MNGHLNDVLMYGFEGVLYGISSGSMIYPGAQGQAKLGISVSDDAWIYKTVGAGYIDGSAYGLLGVGGEILITDEFSLFGQVAMTSFGDGQIRVGFHYYPQN